MHHASIMHHFIMYIRNIGALNKDGKGTTERASARASSSLAPLINYPLPPYFRHAPRRLLVACCLLLVACLVEGELQ